MKCPLTVIGCSRHTKLHSLLGHVDVWRVLHHQRDRTAQFAHSHDESLVPADQCKLH